MLVLLSRSYLCFAPICAGDRFRCTKTFFIELFLYVKAGPGKHRFRFKNKLLSLDSATISLCLSLFPWAKFRRTKGAIKLHLLLDHEGYLATYVYITNGKKHDVIVARKDPLTLYSIVAMDRGHNDYSLFAHWTDNHIYLVTRLRTTLIIVLSNSGLCRKIETYQLIS